ncbi:MAG: ankyrin repeat domain-containing protein [Candidatus Micrarchaeaceae archaeon]
MKKLTFDDIVISMDNYNNPNKILLIKLLKTFNKKYYTLNKQKLLYNSILNHIDKYDLKSDERYLDYAFKTKIYEIIELFINNNAKISDYSISQILKCYILYEDNLIFHDKIQSVIKSINKYKFILDLLVDKTKLKFKFRNLCSIGCKKLIKYTYYVDINELNWGLYEACKNGHYETVTFLIHEGANNFSLAFQGACESGQKEIVDLILQKNVNDLNKGLTIASENGNIDIVKLLLQNNVNNLDDALFKACKSGNLEVVKLLIQNGAIKISIAIDIAKNNNHNNIVDFLNKIKIIEIVPPEYRKQIINSLLRI